LQLDLVDEVPKSPVPLFCPDAGAINLEGGDASTEN
jgi:hypothetical protein